VRYVPGASMIEADKRIRDRRDGSEDDDLGHLPPLDGGTEEPESPAPDLDDEDIKDDGGDPLDDGVGKEEDAIQFLEIGGAENGWLDEEVAGGEDLDGVDLFLDEADDLLSDNDEPGVGDEDYDLGENEDSSVIDAGEEGPGEDDEELREEDLPRLDADEGGAPEDSDFIDEGFGLESEALGVPWARETWERAGAPVEVAPMRAVACVPRGVLAGGAGLWRIDLEGGRERLSTVSMQDREVLRVLADGARIVVTTEGAGVWISRDGGASFVAADGWRGLVQPNEAAVGLEVTLAGDELWGATAQGSLLWSGDLGAHWEKVDGGGFVAAVSVDDARELVALVRTLGGAAIARGRRGALAHTSLPLGLVSSELSVRALLAARGLKVAMAIEGSPVCVSLDGVSWTGIPGTETATALDWQTDEGVLVVGLYDSVQERAWLARVSPRANVHVVAEVFGARPDGEGGILSLACDDARGVVWIAGGFGVAAFQPKTKTP
jgi:hypothetical protein